MKSHYTSIFEQFPTRLQSLWHKGSVNKIKKAPLLVLSEQDYVFFRNKNNSLTQISQLILFDSYLFIPERYINLENLRLQKINFQTLSGLKISSNNESVEIFSTDPLICKMYNIIKRFTIQMDFQFKFLKLKCLGKGSFAKVYKIMSMEDKSQYATKQFTKSPKNQDINAAQLSIFKEIGILRQIKHDNIIRLYEVYEDENQIYIILDLLEGGELLEALEKKKDGYDENLAQNIIWQLLTAVNYLHSLNIIHRDIKPENIILRKKNKLNEIAIADFGLAEIYNEQSHYLYTQCGTVGYAAPEIYQGSNYDHKVDLFSIGAVMFMLLSGEPAFQGGNSQEELKNNMECNVCFDKLKKKCIRDNGIDLCQKLLQKDPKLRFSAEQALNHDWFHTPIMDSYGATNLQINIIPQIKVKMQVDILKSTSPLWRNDSPLTSHSSKSHSCQLLPENDQGIDYIDEGLYFKQFQDFEQDSDLIEDFDSDQNLSAKIQKYQTLSKEISMSKSYKDIR